MALFTPSCLISEIRGSVGTSNFSKNRYGPIVRQKLTQTNPNTTKQQAVRSVFASAVAKWQALTQAERDAFNDIAKDYPKQNSLGKTYRLSGYSLFISKTITGSLLGDDDPTYILEKDVISPCHLVSVGFEGSNLIARFSQVDYTEQHYLLLYMAETFNKNINAINPSLLKFSRRQPIESGNPVNLSDVYFDLFGSSIPLTGSYRVHFGYRTGNIFTGDAMPLRIAHYDNV